MIPETYRRLQATIQTVGIALKHCFSNKLSKAPIPFKFLIDILKDCEAISACHIETCHFI